MLDSLPPFRWLWPVCCFSQVPPDGPPIAVAGNSHGCIIAGSMLFASWVTVLGPLYRTHHGSLLKQTLSLAYPASDVVMVSLVIILFARAGKQGRGSLALVMAGLIAFAVADSAFSYLTEVNNYGIGSFLDTGWVAGYLLIGLGALRAVYMPSTEAAEPRVYYSVLGRSLRSGTRRAGGDCRRDHPWPSLGKCRLDHGPRFGSACPRPSASRSVGPSCVRTSGR